MKEIKFEAVYKNKVYQVHTIEFFLDGSYSVLLRTETDIVFPEMEDVTAIRQFTGLQDVTGKDIYEGDIVLSDWGYISSNVTFEEIFYAKSECTISDKIKIIGNIYENPELVKAKK